MSTPSPLSPVVGEAQASPKLTDVERAAMGTDLHVIACDTPLGECVECMTLLRTIRRIITAVTKPLKERLEAAELVCKIFGFTAVGGPETDHNKAVAQAWSDWFNAYGGTFGTHVRPADLPIAELAARRDEIRDRTLAAIRAESEDGIDSDGAPVAAASNPTPIPDGEE